VLRWEEKDKRLVLKDAELVSRAKALDSDPRLHTQVAG